MNERSAVPPPTRYPKVNCGAGFATNSEIQKSQEPEGKGRGVKTLETK
jgi:hypothetical protein